MDRKRRFTTPTEALVQFEEDRMTEIVSVKKIIDEPDCILEGNVVNVSYDGEEHRVKIIKLSSKLTCTDVSSVNMTSSNWSFVILRPSAKIKRFS